MILQYSQQGGIILFLKSRRWWWLRCDATTTTERPLKKSAMSAWHVHLLACRFVTKATYHKIINSFQDFCITNHINKKEYALGIGSANHCGLPTQTCNRILEDATRCCFCFILLIGNLEHWWNICKLDYSFEQSRIYFNRAQLRLCDNYLGKIVYSDICGCARIK